MIVIHTDASCQAGWCCWVYKSSSANKHVCGIFKSKNSALAECLAIYRALRAHRHENTQILIVTDFLTATYWINNENYNDKLLSKAMHTVYKKIKNIVDHRHKALWVRSENTSRDHQLVDHLSKTILKQHLQDMRTYFKHKTRGEA